MLIDQGRRWPGVWVPFFGRPAHMTTTAAEFARRTGAALVPLAIQRAGLRHRITVLPAVDVDWERPGAVAAATATLARAIESLVWRSPTQWAWTYSVWSRAGVVGGPGRWRGKPEDSSTEEASTAAASAPPRASGIRSATLVPFLIATVLAVTELGCGGGEDRAASPPARTAPAGEALPNQELTEFVLRETDETGRLTWIFRAAEARIYEDRDQVDARGIHIDFFDAAGRVSSVLSADRAVIERRTNDMQAAGNVVVRNSEGHELHTEELQYSSERGKIFTDQFVRVFRGRDVLTGYGLETDPDLERGEFEIQREFEATVRDEAVPEVGNDAGGGAGGEGERGTQ
jgi:LPS export ABC transporter protein LptC